MVFSDDVVVRLILQAVDEMTPELATAGVRLNQVGVEAAAAGTAASISSEQWDSLVVSINSLAGSVSALSSQLPELVGGFDSAEAAEARLLDSSMALENANRSLLVSTDALLAAESALAVQATETSAAVDASAASLGSGGGGEGFFMAAATGAFELGKRLAELAGITAAVTAGFSFFEGAKLEDQFLTIANNTGLTNRQMEEMDRLSLKLAEDGRISAGEIAQAFEHVSNVLSVHGETAMQVVVPAWKAAQETGAQLGDTANALATILGNTKTPIAEAARVMSLIVTAAQSGNLQLGDLATNFQKVGSIGTAEHQSLEQLLAVFSTLTKATGDAAISQTYAAGILSHLLTISGPAQKLMAQLAQTTGVDLAAAFREAATGQITLTQLFEKAREATKGNASEIYTLFGGLRGGTGAIQILTSHWNDYLATLQKLHDQSNRVNEDWDRTRRSIGFLAGELVNKLQLIGYAALQQLQPQITGALRALNGFAGWFIAHRAEVRGFWDAIGNGVQAVLNWLHNFGTALAPTLATLRTVGLELENAFIGAWKSIAPALTDLGNTIFGTSQKSGQAADSARAWANVLNNVLVPSIYVVATVLDGLIHVIGFALTGAIQLQTTIVQVFKTVATNIHDLATVIYNLFHGNWGKFLDETGLQNVVDFMDGVIGAALDKISGFLDLLSNIPFVGGAFGDLRNKVEGFKASLDDTTHSAQTLHNTLSGTINMGLHHNWAQPTPGHTPIPTIWSQLAPPSKPEMAHLLDLGGVVGDAVQQAAPVIANQGHFLGNTLGNSMISGIGGALRSLPNNPGIIAQFDALSAALQSRLTRLEDKAAMALYHGGSVTPEARAAIIAASTDQQRLQADLSRVQAIAQHAASQLPSLNLLGSAANAAGHALHSVTLAGQSIISVVSAIEHRRNTAQQAAIDRYVFDVIKGHAERLHEDAIAIADAGHRTQEYSRAVAQAESILNRHALAPYQRFEAQQQRAQTDLTQAQERFAYDLLHHTGNLTSDAEAVRRAEAAVKSFSDALTAASGRSALTPFQRFESGQQQAQMRLTQAQEAYAEALVSGTGNLNALAAAVVAAGHHSDQFAHALQKAQDLTAKSARDVATAFQALVDRAQHVLDVAEARYAMDVIHHHTERLHDDALAIEDAATQTRRFAWAMGQAQQFARPFMEILQGAAGIAVAAAGQAAHGVGRQATSDDFINQAIGHAGHVAGGAAGGAASAVLAPLWQQFENLQRQNADSLQHMTEAVALSRTEGRHAPVQFRRAVEAENAALHLATALDQAAYSIAKHSKDHAAAIQALTTLHQHQLSQAQAFIAQSLLANRKPTDWQLDWAAKESRAVQRVSNAMDQAAYMIALRAGDFGTALQDLSNILNNNVSKAQAKYALDLYNNTGNLTRDGAALQRAAAAANRLAGAQAEAAAIARSTGIDYLIQKNSTANLLAFLTNYNARAGLGIPHYQDVQNAHSQTQEHQRKTETWQQRIMDHQERQTRESQKQTGILQSIAAATGTMAQDEQGILESLGGHPRHVRADMQRGGRGR